VIFHPDTDDFYTCGLDGSVIIHTMNNSGYYEYDGMFDTSEYGGAYSMNANLSDVLLVSANKSILVFDLYGGGSDDLLA
jgi:WD40 repeat protein